MIYNPDIVTFILSFTAGGGSVMLGLYLRHADRVSRRKLGYRRLRSRRREERRAKLQRQEDRRLAASVTPQQKAYEAWLAENGL